MKSHTFVLVFKASSKESLEAFSLLLETIKAFKVGKVKGLYKLLSNSEEKEIERRLQNEKRSKK